MQPHVVIRKELETALVRQVYEVERTLLLLKLSTKPGRERDTLYAEAIRFNHRTKTIAAKIKRMASDQRVVGAT